MVSAENKPETISAALICESCGKQFLCGASVGECWCFAVELPPESLTNLREKYKNCLCEDCLKETKPISSVEL